MENSVAILGGSRQEGEPTVENTWNGEETVGSSIRIGEVDVPEPILTLNRELIQNLNGTDIEPCGKTAVYGYRFVRDPLRIECVEEGGRPLIHNYGHGGSGITLSWGAALEVAREVRKELSVVPPENSFLESSHDEPLLSHLRMIAFQNFSS